MSYLHKTNAPMGSAKQILPRKSIRNPTQESGISVWTKLTKTKLKRNRNQPQIFLAP